MIDPFATPPQADRGLREAAEAVVLAAKKHTPEIIALNRALALRDTPPAGLDAAWAEAEAALPEGWDLSLMSLRMHVKPTLDGPEVYAATASAPPDADHPYTRVISSEEGRPRGSKHDATPAAALLALVARLREQADG